LKIAEHKSEDPKLHLPETKEEEEEKEKSQGKHCFSCLTMASQKKYGR